MTGPILEMTLEVPSVTSISFAFEVLDGVAEKRVPTRSGRDLFQTEVPLVQFELDLDRKTLTVRGWNRAFEAPYRKARAQVLR